MKDILRWPIALMIISMVLLQACSIIEDSDIQSQEELDTKLKLSKITFIEQYDDNFNADALTIVGTTSINNTGQIAKIDWGGGIVINDPTNDVSIARFNYVNDANLEVPETISSNITYGANGSPSKITHIDEVNNFQFESFEFTYDSQGNMTSMVTTRNSNGGVLNQMTTDVLTYENEQIASVSRTTVDLNAPLNETFQTITTTRNSLGVIRQIRYNFSDGSYRFFDQANPDNSNSFFYFSQITSGNESFDPSGNPVILPVVSERVQSMQLIDSRTGANGETFAEDRNPDVFFIHPLLILQDFFPNGLETSQIFINDWWLVSPIIGVNFYNTDRIAHVNYEYQVD